MNKSLKTGQPNTKRRKYLFYLSQKTDFVFLIVKREREENLDSHSYIVYLQLRKYIYTRLGVLTTIYVTYIKKGKIVHYKFIIFNTPPQAGAYTVVRTPSLVYIYFLNCK